MAVNFLQAQQDTQNTQTKFLNPPEVNPAAANQPSFSSELVDFYASALKKTPEEVQQDVANGAYPLLRNEANQQANSVSASKSQGIINNIIATQPKDPTKALGQAREGLLFKDHVSPDVSLMLNEKSPFAVQEKTAMARAVTAQRMVQARLKSTSKGFLADVGYFADSAISQPLQNILGLTGSDKFASGSQLVDMAKQAQQLFYSGMSDQEFQTEFGKLLDRAGQAGLFSNENPLLLDQFINLINEGGRGSGAQWSKVGQAVDVASVALPIIGRGAGLLSEAPQTLSKLSSLKSGTSMVTRYVEGGVDSAVGAENTSARMIKPIIKDPSFYSGPDLPARRALESNSAAMQQFHNLHFGDYVDPEIIKAKTDDFLGQIKENNLHFSSNEINYNIRTDPNGNLYGEVFLGTNKGTPYKTEAAAKKLAAKIPDSEVIPQMFEGKQHYIVKRTNNLKTAGLAQPTDIKQLSGHWYTNFMSTTARTEPRLDAMVKQGEAQGAKGLRDIGKSYNAAKARISRDEASKVSGILTELRDDPNFNMRHENYNSNEFADRYFAKYGEIASPRVIEYWDKLSEISHLDWAIKADRVFKDAVNNGETMAKFDNAFYRVRKVDTANLNAGDHIYLPKTQKFVDVGSGTFNKDSIYQIHNNAYQPEGIGAIRYIDASDAEFRRLYHSDVMGFNAGGPRSYLDRVQFFLKQPSEFTLGDGTTLHGIDKTFMGVRLESEARQGVSEWNAIAQAIKDGLSEEEVNKIIRANNNWNHSIEDVADFQRFAADHNLDPAKPINFAGDGQPLADQNFAGSRTVGESFRNTMNSNKMRGDRPLVGWGGDSLDAVDPTRAIERSFAASMSRRGDQAYLFNAINGWIKAAKDAGVINNIGDISEGTPRFFLENAKIDPTTEAGKALINERNTIKFRLNNTTSDMAYMHSAMNAMADGVYKAGYKKLAKIMDWSHSKDPTSFFRAMAFNLKLGMFAMDQVVVQASQLINSMAIVGFKHGFRGMAGVLPMRLAMVEGIPDVALNRIAKLQQVFTSMTPEEFINLRNWIVQSGRNVVDRTVVQENNMPIFSKKYVTKLLDYGRAPFNEGELMARIGAANMNFLERKAMYGAEDIFNDTTTRAMLHRQDVLSASMTSASSATWQKSFASVPLQFTTYLVRMGEQLFTDRILSTPERIRLGLTQLVMYGTAGVPLAGFITDYYQYNYGTGMSNEMYQTVRYGLLDGIIGALSGEDTALSSRIAAGQGAWDFFYNIWSGRTSAVEAIGGPSMKIGVDAFDSMQAFARNMFAPNFDMASYDFTKIGRNVTSFDRMYGYWMASHLGKKISRATDQPILSNLSQVDALLIGMGIPLTKEYEAWSMIQQKNVEDAMIKKHAKNVLRLSNIAQRQINDGDYEGAKATMTDMGAMMSMMDPYEKQKIFSQLKYTMTLPESLIQNALRRGKPELAAKLAELNK